MHIYQESDLLNPEFRKSIIDEIEGPENRKRKCESLKRYEIYRDRIKKYILENLLAELDPETVNEMQSRVSTINIYKKMIQKKARVYKDTPTRSADNDDIQEIVETIVDNLNLNNSMKKTNRYVEAFRNSIIYVKPFIDHENEGKWSLLLETMAPHQYDVIEDRDNPSIARAVVLSHYNKTAQLTDDDPQTRAKTGVANNFRDGDGKNQKIADSPADDEKEYIFWSNNHHFTCNEKGEIISKDDETGEIATDNPIKRLPFVSFFKDQDGSYWSTGGDDMVEGSILVNTLLTDIYYIAKIQGMGIFYLFGKGVPKKYKVGPNRGITLEVEEGDPTPQIGFANSNPPIDSHMKMTEQYIALLLSTNDLGVNAIQGSLSADTAQSGIHELIQNAEPMTAIEDEQQQYKDKEKDIVEIAARWIRLYDDGAIGVVSKYKDAVTENVIEYSLKFEEQQHFTSEADKWNVVKTKNDIGIWNKVDAMIQDNPELSRDEALELLLKQAEENLKLAEAGMASIINQGIDGDTNTENTEIEPRESAKEQPERSQD